MDNNETAIIETPPLSRLADYKAVCMKLGLLMCFYYICRISAVIMIRAVYRNSGISGETALYLLQSCITVMMVYVLPLVFAFILFKNINYNSEKIRGLYKKPRRLAQVFGNFPAMYGLGYGTTLITMLVMNIISRLAAVSGSVEVADFFNPPALIEPTTDWVSAVVMVIMMVVFAAVFEELLLRGIMYDALRPYGAGIAIVITSVLFGFMHGSLQMLFYTTAVGFAMGYIRYATNSLFAVTILHALFNAVAALLLFLISAVEITNAANKLLNTVYNIYSIAMLVLVIAGIVAFIRKIPVIRKYKIANEWTEISGGKKAVVFFTSVSVLAMLVLAFNEHADYILLRLFSIR